MGPAGLVFLAIGSLLMRQVFMGRVDQTGQDLKTIGYSALTGDFSTLANTLTTRGSGNPAPSSGGSTPADNSTTPTGGGVSPKAVNGSGIAAIMQQLGDGKGYSQVARTGPNSYDCSGLVWAAMRQMGYKGGPFWTGSFGPAMEQSGFASRVNVSDPASAPVDTIVLWSLHHMGAISSPGILYSARSHLLNPQIGPEPLADFI
jgi:hypothetical protein